MPPAHRAPRARPWSASRRELALLELRDKQIEGAVEHGRDIARGDLVAEQLLSVAQLIVRALADGELQKEALGGDRRQLRARRVRRNWFWNQLA